jgi:fructose-1,6-bisphosphatase
VQNIFLFGLYIGALVADVHNIILHGGIFAYPSSTDAPKGKIRLLYEANPIGLIIEEAGGLASTGNGRILDTPVTDIHQRTPVFFGSVDQISALEKYVSFYQSN